MQENRIQYIENYVKQILENRVAHDFKHADRVRCWAVQIAQSEGFSNRELVEATALLHDIGQAYPETPGNHGIVGADIVAQFFITNPWFSDTEIHEMTYAIRHHSSLKSDAALLRILRDADMLDLLGAVGLMRAFTHKASLPEYDPQCIRGDMWEKSAEAWTERLAQGNGFGPYILDLVNFQISCYALLHTQKAKEIGRPLAAFSKAFVLQLENEITLGRNETEHCLYLTTKDTKDMKEER